MTKHKPEVAEFILCEDIREEVNGKVSLMGLYRDMLAFRSDDGVSWPRALRHAIYIRIRHLPPENLRVTLRVEAGEAVLFAHEGKTESSNDSPKTELNINANLAIFVPGYGELVTRLRVEDDGGKLLLEKTRSLAIVEAAALTHGAETRQGA